MPLPDIDEFAKLARVLRQFGVSGAAENLTDQAVLPETCMRAAHSSLDFMGFGGRKWRSEPWFHRELDRLQRRGGHVRMLVSGQVADEGASAFTNLLLEFPDTLQIRLMDVRSVFRLVVVDRRWMLFAHYGYEVVFEDGSNAQGWNSPQLIIEQGPEWSLINPFMLLYDQVWDRAVPLVQP